jgi:hypothetical protein
MIIKVDKDGLKFLREATDLLLKAYGLQMHQVVGVIHGAVTEFTPRELKAMAPKPEKKEEKKGEEDGKGPGPN